MTPIFKSALACGLLVLSSSVNSFAGPAYLPGIASQELTLFTKVSSKQQCLQQCSNFEATCREAVRINGDAAGWDGDLRLDAFIAQCAPKISQCQEACGPIGPGECRMDSEGNELCS